MTGYLANIRESVLAASNERSPPMGALPAVVYGSVLAYVGFWIAVGPDVEWYSHYLREGSPVDLLSTTFLGTGAALAGVALLLGGQKRTRMFWLLCTLGAIFLMLDERLQLHEEAPDLIGDGAWGDPPLGLRNWNDVIMAGYGVVALVLGLLTLPAFLRHRRVRALLVTSFGFFALHTAIDMSFEASALKDVFEEPFKLLSGASLMLAFMAAAQVELQQRASALAAAHTTRTGVGLGWIYPTVFLGLAAAWAWLVTEPTSDALFALLWDRWGYPQEWLTAVYLQLSAIAIVSAAFLGRIGEKTRWLGLPLAVWLWFVSVGEAMNASRYRFTHDRVEGDFLPSLRRQIDVLHADLDTIHWVTLAGLLLAVAIGATLWRRRPRAAAWLGVGLLTLVAAPAIDVVTAGMSEALSVMVEDVLSPSLRVIGSACVALGGLSVLIGSDEGSKPHPANLLRANS